MGELRGTECLDQYGLEVLSTRRGRGAVICETGDGSWLLREYQGSENRALFEEEVLTGLVQSGFKNIDVYLRTTKGNLLAEGADGTNYLLRRWFAWGECDMKNQSDILAAVRQLAKLHFKLRGLKTTPLWEQKSVRQIPDAEVLERHNRELRRARQYVKRRKNKNDFELLLAASYETFYREAEEAAGQMSGLSAGSPVFLCHGDYNNHHVLMGGGEIAVTEFGKAHLGRQIWDLYFFMRKTMEKHGWNQKLGKMMLEAYGHLLPIEKEEWRYLYLLFLYPEKYWKQLNYYFNSNKAWIPERNVDKLRTVVRQQEARSQFLRMLERV